MTKLAKVMAAYPALLFTGWVASAASAIAAPSLIYTGLFVFLLYLFPPLCFRLHAHYFPRKGRTARLVGGGYVPWWGGHQIQLLYLAFPAVEVPLRLVPGLYSAWLRLWGSQIGRHVYWTPQVMILDRDLLEIGDHVVIGHLAIVGGHIITPSEDNLVLYVQKVVLGDGAFIGAMSALGPGVVVEPGALVPATAQLRPRERVKK